MQYKKFKEQPLSAPGLAGLRFATRKNNPNSAVWMKEREVQDETVF